MNRIWAKLFLTILAFTFFVYSIGDNYRDGLAALNEGRKDEAALKLKKAFEKDPANPLVKIAYASIAEPAEANKLYRELAQNDTVADSIRSKALFLLGDYLYACKQFKESADKYREAAKMDPEPVYKHNWALALYASGDEEAAQSIWYTLSLEYGNDISRMAQYYLGLIHFKRGDYDKAYGCFLKTGSVEPEKFWTVASLAGKIECATHLGMTDKVKQYTEQLKPYRKNLLERDLLQLTVSDKKNTYDYNKMTPKKGSSQSDSKQLYTLQVGAFGSPQNASNLQKKLSEKYENVSVFPVTHSDQVFYRVRIGTFSSREDAESFAEKKMVKSGLNYQVVPK